MEQTPVFLRAGNAVCEIWPDKGGSIAHWAINGQNMFRAANPDAGDDTLPLGMASFPLVPYSNRIGFGRFDWDGSSVQLEPNFPPEEHALHGTGWTAKWEIASQTDNSVVLHHDHKADQHWPWDFKAEQHILITEFGLTIDMVARNLSDQMAPLGFGHHPYFDREGATLSFGADTIWQTGDDGLPAFPEQPVAMFDFDNGVPVAGRDLDNCYCAWDGHAKISWAGRPLQLDIISSMPAAVVYVPRGENYFCFEPVPHIINALNLPQHQPSMPVVGPGESYQANIQFMCSIRALPHQP